VNYLLANQEWRREGEVLCGCGRRNAKGEGGMWTCHATSSAQPLLHEKSEAGKQLNMDGCLKTSSPADPPTTFGEILPPTSVTINTKHILLILSPIQSPSLPPQSPASPSPSTISPYNFSATRSLTHKFCKPSNVILVSVNFYSLLLI
jgi:hypothetical protein